MYAVICNERNIMNGDMAAYMMTKKPVMFLRTATEILRQQYQEYLLNHRLEDNGAANDDGCAIPGGYFCDSKFGVSAGVYNYCGYANDQLLETFHGEVVKL